MKVRVQTAHEKSLEDATVRFKRQIALELNDLQFNWNRLISLILEEDSPLQEVFTSKTLHLAALVDAAVKVQQFASELDSISELEEVPEGEDVEKEDESKEGPSSKIN